MSRGPRLEVRVAEDPETYDEPPRTRVLGVDPGFRAVGLLVLDFSADGVSVRYRERVTTKTSDGDAGTRLDAIARRVHSTFSAYLPDVVGIEDITNVGFQRGESSAAASQQLKVPGIVRGLALVYGAPPVYDVATSSGRVALFGRGRSRAKTKQDVIDRFRELLGVRLNSEQADAGASAFGAFARYCRERG